MTNSVRYELVEGIGVITVDNPPVNALSHAVRAGLLEAVRRAQADASEAVLLICAGRTFIAGADISEFGQPPQAPLLPEVLSAIEASRKLVVAAIHGTALGGGLETALACHYRCALPSAQVGLPEVKLGLLPGAGGTQRVPRVAGVRAALEFITNGTPVSAAQARDMGLIHELIDGDDLRAGALRYVHDLLESGALLKRIRDINIDPSSIEPGFFAGYRAQLAKRARGQIAPDRIVSAVEAAVTLPMDKGLARERELFAELVASPESRAMRHLFFAEREASKIKDVPRETPTRPIRSVAVVGAGTMGGGIAMCFANVGVPVTLLEVSDEALQRGLGVIRRNYSGSVQKGKLTQADMDTRLALIRGTTADADLAEADLVIEAVFENPDLKKDVFVRLDRVCKPGAILATNTSYQNIDEIAAVTGRPQDVLGMHFFSPANIMKLLEVVRGAHTRADVLATAMQVGKVIGKVCVLARVCYGFIGNRMLQGYLREGQMLLLRGCTPTQVDTALEAFGMAMGIFAVADLAGLDVGYRARQARRDDPTLDPVAYRVADRLVEMGRLGQKSGAGFHRYDPATRARQADPEVEALIRSEASGLGLTPRTFSDDEIVERCLFPLINEGARILEEGIAQRPSDIDVVYVHGYAFPAAKGGPMHYADHLGLSRVVARMAEFAAADGDDTWTPAPLLARLAAQNRSFADWARDGD